MKNYIHEIQEALNEFYQNHYKGKTFNYFYEEDVRSHLMSMLVNKLKDKTGIYGIDNQFKQLIGRIGNNICSGIVKAEYPSSQRFDIAILPTEGADFYNLRPCVAIEIKLGSIETKTNNFGKFSGDIKSLQEYVDKSSDFKTVGIALYFYQTKLTETDIENVSKWIGCTLEEILEIDISSKNIHAFLISEDRIYACKL